MGIKRKIKKRLNPSESQIIALFKANNIDLNLIGSGEEGIIYYFKLNKRFVFPIDGILLNKGEYVVKILQGYDELDDKNIQYLKLLSNYGLIPKIYLIKTNIIIMDYINGITYYDFILKNKLNDKRQIVDDKIEHIKNIWYKLGFRHRDLNYKNILVTNDLKVYFIDPALI